MEDDVLPRWRLSRRVTPGDPAPIRHRRVLALALPIIVSNLSIPLMGAVDVAVMGHLPDAAYLGGVALGALVFSYV